LHNLALLRVKNANFFAIFFGKIFEKSWHRSQVILCVNFVKNMLS
jgi:hypothetical protein